MIRILFFVPHLVGGGAERVTINIMKVLDKNIFDVHLVVATTKYSVYKNLPEGITFHNLNVLRTMSSVFKLRRLIQELNPDILFSSLIRGHIAINMALIGLKEKPFLIFRSPNSPKSLLKYNKMNNIQKILLENAYRKADIVLAQTPEMKDEIIQYHKINNKKIKVFINPIDSDLIDEKIKNINNPFNTNDINVVAAGRIVYQKGFDILIKSFKHIVKTNNLFKLYIIGQDGTGEQKNLQKIVNELNLTKNIFFLGYQENPYRYFYFCDLYVLSSRWEGLPNTVLENLYLQKPVVATRCIPFMDSLIKEGKNGLLVDIDDVHALSNAVLNYKNLTFEFSDPRNVKEDVNNFFKNMRI